MDKYQLDGSTRRIAGGCSLVAGALAVFWLMQTMRGHLPARIFFVKANIVTVSLAALSFGLVGSRREVPRMIANASLTYTYLSFSWAIAMVYELYSRGAPDLGPAGIVTVAVAAGLFVAAVLVRKRQGRGAAQPAVAADGASPSL